MKNRTTLNLALMFSLALHLLLWSNIDIQLFTASNGQTQPATTSLNFTLIETPVDTKAETEVATTATPQVATPAQPLKTAELEVAVPQTQAKVPALLANPVAELPIVNKEKNTLLLESRNTKLAEVSAFELYTSPRCNPQQRASAVTICASNEFTAETEDLLLPASLISDSGNSGSSIERDMDRIEQLLRHSAELVVLDATDKAQLALVAQQRAHFHREVLRIDRSHQQVNLLRLLPASSRLVKSLKIELTE